MKKLLSLLLILLSYPVFSEIQDRELLARGYDLSLSDFCVYQPGVQNRGGDNWKLFFPNQEEGITATSVCVKKDAFGQIGEKGELVKGLQEGKWISYWRNGQKQYERNYKNGLLHGKSYWWTEDGIKTSEGNHENNKRHGDSIRWFYDTGQIMSKKTYKYSNLDGMVTFWQPDGKKWFEVVYKNGKRIEKCNILNKWNKKFKKNRNIDGKDAIQIYCKDK